MEVTSSGLPAAVLFDLDGLLIDSEPVWYDVESAVVERLGGVWSKAHQAQCVGGTIDKTCTYILDLTGATLNAEDLQAELLDAMVTSFHRGVGVLPGAGELVKTVADAGVPMGVVSSSYRTLVDAALEQFGTNTFAVTVTGDEVSRGKPHPEPYALACERLGVEPVRCVVLEDAPMGVASAEAAGCRVIAVPDHAIIEPTPHRLVFDSLAEVDLDVLRRLVA